ncbi:MAG: 16S rRNA (uracil(1498)-N(3))-methyltransferase [Sedimentisphaerales bacterium]|nr:16S rRNA (uracil(1498)-N(3))-methyltransferase [Sedimentisphaerales bacterium]
MQIYRFYCESLTGSKVELEGTEAHHLAVLRLGPGAQVELFDGNGTLATAVVSGIRKNIVSLDIENIRRTDPPKSRRIIIAVSVPKGDRFDWLIEKLTELGVERICPVIFERTVRQPSNPKALDRLYNLAVSAAKQSKRLFLPQIDPPANLHDCLESIKKDTPNCRIIAGAASSDSPSLATLNPTWFRAAQPFGQNDVAALIGPEGGLTDNEETFLKNSGVHFVRLSDTILRTETAAISFAAILSAQRD